MKYLVALLLFIFTICGESAVTNDVSGTFFGVGDGVYLNTTNIQIAIATCPSGGTVWLHDGVFLTGTVILTNNINFLVYPNATLLWSTNVNDQPSQINYAGNAQEQGYCLLSARNNTNFTVSTGGAGGGSNYGYLDGNGYYYNYPTNFAGHRGNVMCFELCSNFMVNDLNIRGSPGWNMPMIQCYNAIFTNLFIDSTNLFPFRDGSDWIDCNHILFENSTILAGDDAVCLKSGNTNGCNNNIFANINILGANANGIKFGTTSIYLFTNNLFTGFSISNTAKAAMAVESVDGANINGAIFTNIFFTTCQNGIFVLLGNRNPGGVPGSLANIIFENIFGTNMTGRYSMQVSGTSEANGTNYMINNILFTNVNIQVEGTKLSSGTDYPEYGTNNLYPENTMYGTSGPTFGWYLRHITNCIFLNSSISEANNDYRFPQFQTNVPGLIIVSNTWVMPVFDWFSMTNYLMQAPISKGDLVTIPAGTNSWFGTISINGWTLAGQGTNQTVVVDETLTNGSGLSIASLNNSYGFTRLTGIKVTVGVTNNYLVDVNTNGLPYPGGAFPAAARGVIICNGSGTNRIDNCMFNQMTGKPILINNRSTTCIDHCSFPEFAIANAIEVFGTGATDPYGDYPWSVPYPYGGVNTVCIEDCYFNSAYNFMSIDTSYGGSDVIRHNIFIGTFVFDHGLDSGQRYRSARVTECYSNTFIYTPASNQGYAITMHGGTLICFNNHITNVVYGLINFQDYRTTDNSPYYLPWYGATGTSGYDSNSPALLNGTATGGGAGKLIDSSANWTINQWVGDQVYNVNSNLCGQVVSNNTTTMFFNQNGQPQYLIGFKSGDVYTNYLTYPTMDQVGRGYGVLVSNSVPTAVWSQEALEPTYVWGNIKNISNNATAFSSYPNIQLNRDYYNSAMPGYIPLTYPNPIITGNSQPIYLSPPIYFIILHFNKP